MDTFTIVDMDNINDSNFNLWNIGNCNRFKEFINDVEIKLIEDGGIYRL